jgi:hypothetical protein
MSSSTRCGHRARVDPITGDPPDHRHNHPRKRRAGKGMMVIWQTVWGLNLVVGLVQQLNGTIELIRSAGTNSPSRSSCQPDPMAPAHGVVIGTPGWAVRGITPHQWLGKKSSSIVSNGLKSVLNQHNFNQKSVDCNLFMDRKISDSLKQ